MISPRPFCRLTPTSVDPDRRLYGTPANAPAVSMTIMELGALLCRGCRKTYEISGSRCGGTTWTQSSNRRLPNSMAMQYSHSPSETTASCMTICAQGIHETAALDLWDHAAHECLVQWSYHWAIRRER